MKNLFDADGTLMAILTKIADTVWLNILFLVCSLPIFTIGASLTALYYVTFKTIKSEEGYISKDFFRSFKENFKQSTIIWFILLILYVILGMDLAFLFRMNSSLADIGIVLVMIPGLLVMFVGIYVFPLLSRFENTTKVTIKNALLLSIANIPKSILMLVITISIPTVCLYNLKLLPLVIICAFSVVAHLNSALIYNVLEKLMPKEDKQEEVAMEEGKQQEVQEEI